jgi:DNA polymerase-3 subunit delta'
MNFWAEIVGQTDAVNTLDRAASSVGRAEQTHAWLITGPPGSGRITVARRFAAALVADSDSETDREAAYTLVAAGTHPDVMVVTTRANQLDVQAMRSAVTTAYYAPAESRLRVIVVEDADRMNAYAANATLKALEEPPETTVWILCAPSEADLLPTIRSRTRTVRLRTPEVAEVATLLESRDGIAREAAQKAARLTQGHIGMARRLAVDDEAMTRRQRTIDLALEIETLGDAMRVAGELFAFAKADGESLVEQQGEEEREAMKRSLGLQPDEAIPPKLKSQFRALDDDLKRRQARSLRDGVDRVLVDLLTLARDVMFVVLDAQQPLVNEEHRQLIERQAQLSTVGQALARAQAIEEARDRLVRGVTPALALEAAFAKQIAARARTENELTESE